MDHFTRYSMALHCLDHKVNTIMKILYNQFITVFGLPQQIHSIWGANFTSQLVKELCDMFGIDRMQMAAYHPMGNGQVECFHQTVIWMIGKLSMDKKAHWYDHLSEVTQAYNSTRSAITGYSLHYLMFGRWHHLPIDFFFPMVWHSEGRWVVSSACSAARMHSLWRQPLMHW